MALVLHSLVFRMITLTSPHITLASRAVFTHLTGRFRSRIPAVAALAAALVIAGCSGDPDEQKARYLANGNRYFEETKYAEAIIEYRNATQVDPRFGPAHAKMAEAYSRQGDRANALHAYVRAADTLPDDIELQLTAGNYLLLARHADDARARAEVVLKRDPKNVRAHILLGNALAGLKDLEKAVAEIEEAIRLDPSRGATYTSLGVLEAARGQRTKAEAAFKKATELAPASVGTHLAMANYYWSARQLAEAEAAFQTARKLAPNDTLVNRGLAAFCLATDRIAEAETYLKVIAQTSKDPSSRLALVDYYLANNRPKEAIAGLEPLKSDPRLGPPASRRLVRAYATIGEQAKAEELTDRLLRDKPDDAETLLLKGEMLFAQGKKDEALERLTAAAKADPTSVPVQFALGRLFSARGDFDAAEKAFSEVLRLNPRAAAAEIELSKLHLVRRGGPAAIKFAEEAVTKAPRNVEARLALVRSLLAGGDLARAEAELAPLVANYGDTAAVVVQQGILAALKKNTAAARKAFERALVIEPGTIEAIGGLVALDLAARDFAGAQTRVQKSLEINPRWSDLLLLAAGTSAAAKDFVAAERHLRQAIEVDPTLLQAYAMLGRLYLSQRKLDEAKAEFETMVRRQTRPVAALTMVGIIEQYQGNTKGARERFEQVLAIDSRAAIASNNLAWIYAESGESLDVALQMAQTAAASLPKSAEVLDTLGWIYYKKKLSSQAVATLSECIENDPKSPVYRYHLGLAYLQAGDQTRGRESLERALALSASFAGVEDARRTLAGLGVRGS